MVKSMLRLVDMDTGEIHGESVEHIVKRQVSRKPRYFMSTVEGCKLLAKKNMSKNEHRVLFMLMANVNYNGFVYVNKTRLAVEYECDRTMISKTITSLEKSGILDKAGTGYKFNKMYITCGEPNDNKLSK